MVVLKQPMEVSTFVCKFNQADLSVNRGYCWGRTTTTMTVVALIQWSMLNK